MRFAVGDVVEIRKANSIKWYRRGVILDIIGSDSSDRSQQQCWYLVRLSTGGRVPIRHHQLRPANILDRLATETSYD
jgi:hypothetical protein